MYHDSANADANLKPTAHKFRPRSLCKLCALLQIEDNQPRPPSNTTNHHPTRPSIILHEPSPPIITHQHLSRLITAVITHQYSLPFTTKYHHVSLNASHHYTSDNLPSAIYIQMAINSYKSSAGYFVLELSLFVIITANNNLLAYATYS